MGRVRRLLISCLVVITAMLLLYAVMLFSTNTIYHYVQKVIKQEIIIVDNKDPLSYFSYGNSEPKGFAYSKFDFKRKNVWHNFRDGQMTIVFSEDVFDENHNLIHQFKDIEVVLYIEKQNGVWNVTGIKPII